MDRPAGPGSSCEVTRGEMTNGMTDLHDGMPQSAPGPATPADAITNAHPWSPPEPVTIHGLAAARDRAVDCGFPPTSRPAGQVTSQAAVTNADRQRGARCADLASSLFGRAEELGDRVRDEVGCLQREEVTATLDNAQADSRGSLEGLSRLVGL
jgi:hypothetical protein